MSDEGGMGGRLAIPIVLTRAIVRSEAVRGP
jgi:hypothetical protein